jgi:thiol peroxidase
MSERTGIITMRGNPLTLIGNEVKVGDMAPDFVVLDNNLSPVKLSSFRGKISVLSSVPSLDTPVCDMETRKFNEAAGRLGKDIAILTISMDLLLRRSAGCRGWSESGSDFIGSPRGFFWKFLRGSDQRAQIACKSGLPHRPKGRIQYLQLVKEVSKEPDYEAVFNALKKLQ